MMNPELDTDILAESVPESRCYRDSVSKSHPLGVNSLGSPVVLSPIFGMRAERKSAPNAYIVLLGV